MRCERTMASIWEPDSIVDKLTAGDGVQLSRFVATI
jgi:hypothetical protein